jgi:hypothetical protein
MRPLESAAIALALASFGCTSAAEDVDFACSKKSCPDGATAEIEGEASITTDDGVKDDSSVPGIDAPSDGMIFPVEDTASPCDGGGSFCGDEEGCKNLATDLLNCGMCGKACAPVAGAKESCTAGKCEFACNAGRADCDMLATNGCEVLTNTDESNCGMCGKKCLASESCVAGTCTPLVVVVENFEPSWPKGAPWASGGGSYSGTASATCAHDGSLGYAAPANTPIHYYRTDVSVGAPGDKLSVWFRTTASGSLSTSGRVYLSFGATSSGAYSLVAAPNTSQLMLERNMPYGTYTALATKSRTWATGVWQKMVVTFGAGGAITGTIYAADGTTVVDSVTATVAGFAPGGVGIRAFGYTASTMCVDTIER